MTGNAGWAPDAAGFNSPLRLPHSYLMPADYLMPRDRHKKSPGITGALERAKGLEPSTFTLAR